MKTLFPIAVSVALFALPVTAQRMGHSNTNAPTVGQSLNFADKGSVELSYASITWARGTWATHLADEATRHLKRDEINEAAKSAPLGTFTTSVDLVMNHVRVSAGSHQLAFMLDEKYQWQVVLFKDGKQVALPLRLAANPIQSKRLVLALIAGDENFTGRMFVTFGDKAAQFSIAIAETEAPVDATDTAAKSFTCPMHPEVKSAEQGRCPTCGMNLVRGQASAR